MIVTELSKPHVYPDPETLGEAVARQIDAAIRAAGDGTFLLGCPGGRSPVPIYAALARLFAARNADLSRLIIVMMDDYVDETPAGFAHVDAAAHYSCRRFGWEDIQSVLNGDIPEGHRIPIAHVWFPDPADPAAYDARIAKAGGIGFFILASGASDGHVAFNPPGSPADSRTRIVELAEATRQDNLATFPDFPDLAAVPRHGVTVGIDTIARHSRASAVVVWGAGKSVAFRRLEAAKGYEADWPATVYRLIPGAVLHADRAAAGTVA